jgi:hypothetical protein
MMTLLLEVDPFADARHWGWRLSYSDGQYIEYGDVSLDPPAASKPELDVDPRPELDRGTAEWMQRMAVNAADLPSAIRQARGWLGEHALPKVGQAILAEAPAAVEVRIPEKAIAVLGYPFELASVADSSADGAVKGLAENDITFVYEIEDGKRALRKDRIDPGLRVLAIFSEPAGPGTSMFYPERRWLASQIGQIASQRGKSVELRPLVLSGETRKPLMEVLQEGAGWDMVHICGYGVSEGLAPWGADGLSMAELAKELKQIRTRLKVVSLIDRQWPAHLHTYCAGHEAPGAAAGQPAITAVAADLARTLDCAVLALRYPADHKFAMKFAEELFINLIRNEQRLPGAVQLATKAAMKEAGDEGGWSGRPGPLLFGSRAVDLSLAPPDRRDPDSYDVRQLKMASFPRQPAQSRVPLELLARAGGVLYHGSQHRGVLFLGASADTKTCAVELSYEHTLDFRKLVFHEVSIEGTDTRGAFDALVSSLDAQLDGLDMAAQVGTKAALRGFSQKLTDLFREHLVLVVLLNVDMLLSSQGSWMDDRWELVIKAMYAHDGDSRLVITSTRKPQDLGGQMVVEAVPPVPATDQDHGERPGTAGR